MWIVVPTFEIQMVKIVVHYPTPPPTLSLSLWKDVHPQVKWLYFYQPFFFD